MDEMKVSEKKSLKRLKGWEPSHFSGKNRMSAKSPKASLLALSLLLFHFLQSQIAKYYVISPFSMFYITSHQ